MPSCKKYVYSDVLQGVFWRYNVLIVFDIIGLKFYKAKTFFCCEYNRSVTHLAKVIMARFDDALFYFIYG